MGLIIEGPDASGKSTLARNISLESGMPLFLAGGKPRNDVEMWCMIADQRHAAKHGSIVDRVSSISQQVYREGLFQREDLMTEALELCEQSIMVYCRPPMDILLDPNKHEWKEYDTPEWKQEILSNQQTYVSRYDFLMTKIPCIIYDWTAENADHLRNMLCEFHKPIIQARLREMVNINQVNK